MARFTYSRRVQFVDTDTAGIMHFSNFYRYMEETELAFWRTLGFKVIEPQPDGTTIGWPRVRASCTFESPARYDDVLDIDLDIMRIGVKSLTFSFVFRRGETRVAAGEIKTVCCRCETSGEFHSVEIPPRYLEKLEGAAA